MVSLTSPGWIVLAGLLSRAVCVQRAMCSSRATACFAPAGVQAVDLGDERPLVAGPRDHELAVAGDRAGIRASHPSTPRGRRARAFLRARLSSGPRGPGAQAAASPSRRTAKRRRRQADDDGLVGLVRVELGLALDHKPTGRGEDLVDPGRRHGLGRVAQVGGGGVEREEGKPGGSRIRRARGYRSSRRR